MAATYNTPIYVGAWKKNSHGRCFKYNWHEFTKSYLPFKYLKYGIYKSFIREVRMQKSNVYELISLVAADLVKEGIAKSQRNTQGAGYMYRGIDDVFNTVGPILAKHGLVILPRCLERVAIERTTNKGGAIFSVTVKAEFDFVSAKDNSSHTVTMYGEAMDVSDKATNKAMSAAYKYAIFQTFCIPTAGDNDADAHTHEVTSEPVIDFDQCCEIEELAQRSHVEMSTIISHYNIGDISDLPLKHFKGLKAHLLKKIVDGAK